MFSSKYLFLAKISIFQKSILNFDIVTWVVLVVLSLLEQVSGRKRICKFSELWKKVIMISFCVFLMIVPSWTSNISKKNLICLMQPNATSGYCDEKSMLCKDNLSQFRSFIISNKTENGITTETFIMEPTGNCSSLVNCIHAQIDTPLIDTFSLIETLFGDVCIPPN